VHEPEDDVMHEGLDLQLGEIYVIAVDPDYQGHGLGRQLVLAGLASLYERDVGLAMLYVDHDNEAARKLYFSLGFTDDHTDRAYVTDVAADDESQSPCSSGGP
jgi:mycothiol synthase